MADGGWFCRWDPHPAGIGTFPVESCDFRHGPYPCGQAVAEGFDGGAAASAADAVLRGRAWWSGRRTALRPVSGSSRRAVCRAFGSDACRAAGVRDCIGGDKDLIDHDASRTDPVTAVSVGKLRRGVGTVGPWRGSQCRAIRSRTVCLRRGPQYPSRWVSDREFAGEGVPEGTGTVHIAIAEKGSDMILEDGA